MRPSTSLALAALGLAASALPAAAGTLLVPKQFPTIQKALNAAKPYDTVQVSPRAGGAAYREAVTISTPHVVLQGRSNPVLDGSTLGTVVTPYPTFPSYHYNTSPNGIEISADHVAVRGMTVQGFGFGDDPLGPASAINVGAFVATGNFTGGEVSYSDIEISGNTLQRNSTGLTIQGYTGRDPSLFPGEGAYLKGYRVLGNLICGNSGGGAVLSGAAVLVSGNRLTGNQSNGEFGDGLDVTGIGVTVSGNESGGNAGDGIKVIDAAPSYDPKVNDPKNPAPTVTAFNYVHDNGGYGIDAEGTQTLAGNAVANSTGYGVYLNYADYSTVTGNVITGTALGGSDDDGTGIYVADSGGYSGEDSGLKISLNQISGNAGDGIYFYEVTGGLISLNNVAGNQGIGIHLSDYTSDYGSNDYAPTTVTQNRAQHNTIFDARDDAAAPDDITYNGQNYYGDGATLYNVWTKNLFGATDPAGLGK